jgi:hypothetical protein
MHLAYCESLLACEHVDEASRAIAEAHAWLCSRAANIDDASLQESFLNNVPEHARIKQLAREHLPA